MANQKPILAILSLRHSLTKEEKRRLKAVFQGQKLTFAQINPADYVEHDEICRAWEARTGRKPLVMLPGERPIPSLAMERGVQHVKIEPETGNLIELGALPPTWKDGVFKLDE